MEPNDRTPTHESLRELLGAYALGAVSDDERQRVAAHLATCAECRAELGALRIAVDALPLSLDALTPPPALRDRLQAAIESSASGDPGVATPAAASRHGDQPPAPIVTTITPWRQRVAPWAAAAAVLLAVSLGMLAWNLQLRDELDRRETVQTIALQPDQAGAGADARMSYMAESGVGVVTLENAPPLDPGEVYQLWLFEGDTPQPFGVFDPATARCAVAADPKQYQMLAITAEPGPVGMPQPTSNPIFVAPILPD